MSFIDRLRRRLSGGDAAERAELAGELGRAVQLWAAAGEVDEAARVMILRGDAEADPKLRLQHYTQAAATAAEGSAIQTSARVKRARLVVSLAAGGLAGTLSAALRQDVIQAAEVLEGAREFVLAADAYALAGDTQGEARACTAAGETERLEEILSRDQGRVAKARATHDRAADVDALIAAGQRREALALAEGAPDDAAARARVSRLKGARIAGPVVRVTLAGRRIALVLGAEVTIGRTEGEITVASSALSRRHVALSRTSHGGTFVVRDLGSRNGTQLRALNVMHPMAVGDGVELMLGNQVPLQLAPSKELPDTLAVTVGGTTYTAPLEPSGGARLGLAKWSLQQASDGWVELVTEGGGLAYAGGLELARRVTLLRGDALAAERAGPPVLRIDE